MGRHIDHPTIPSSALIAEVCVPVLGGNNSALRVERMTEGGSTWVYRVTRAGDTYYVRVLPEQGASFAPEAHVHRALLARGVHVPDVVHWEHFHPVLQRSLMVTTAIQGRPVVPDVTERGVRDVLHTAGRNLALANRIPVDGWGWIVREPDTQGLVAPFGNAREWIEAETTPRLHLLRKHNVFSAPVMEDIRAIFLAYLHMFDHERPYLAHGDFDPSHIFAHDGTYTGIIDWGEIRGAQLYYDLGHFAMHAPGLPYVMAGYAEVTQLPGDIVKRIHFTSLLIALQRLTSGLQKRPNRTPHGPYVAAVQRTVSILKAS